MPISKTYPKEHSPLYRLGRKRALADLLGVSVGHLNRLRSDSNYKTFQRIDRARNKSREIQHPTGELERAHRKLQTLLQRLRTPEYLRSGKKGMSSIKNAKVHSGKKYVLAMDVEHFFPSCKIDRVCGFFLHEMDMRPDVARLLSEIVTYQGHVPTGSSLSMSLAYWACSKAFDRVDYLARKEGVVFTLYVDDMTMSFAAPIPRALQASISHALSRVGLRLKRGKTRYISADQFKVITGVALGPNGEIRVPNRIRQKILDKLKGCGDLSSATEEQLRSILGSLVSARQIEPSFFESTFQMVLRLVRVRH